MLMLSFRSQPPMAILADLQKTLSAPPCVGTSLRFQASNWFIFCCVTIQIYSFIEAMLTLFWKTFYSKDLAVRVDYTYYLKWSAKINGVNSLMLNTIFKTNNKISIWFSIAFVNFKGQLLKSVSDKRITVDMSHNYNIMYLHTGYRYRIL
jgi:hypothetical protein